jgi:hypothetical protein
MATHRRGARPSQWQVADLLRREDRPRGGGALDPRFAVAVGGLLACGAVVTVALSVGEPGGSGPRALPDAAPSPTAQAAPPSPVPPARPADGAPARARHGGTAGGRTGDAMRAGVRAARVAAAGAGGARLGIVATGPRAATAVLPPAGLAGAEAPAPRGAHRPPAPRVRHRGAASGPAAGDRGTSAHRASPGRAAEHGDGAAHPPADDGGPGATHRVWARPVAPREYRTDCPEPRVADDRGVDLHVPAHPEDPSRWTPEESGDAEAEDPALREEEAAVDEPGDRGAGDERDEPGDRHRDRTPDAEEAPDRDGPDRARRADGGDDADTHEAAGDEPATAALGEGRDDVRDLAHRPVDAATLLAVLDDLHGSGRAGD